MSVSTDIPVLQKGTYRHNKSGKLYDVLGVALHTETAEPLVLYRPLYKHERGYELFCRPHGMFVEVVELNGRKVPRFEKIND